MSEHYDLPKLDLPKLLKIFKSGGVFAYPTEGVWGLGCDPFNALAVERLLAIKSRPQEKGLILITGDINHLDPWLIHLPQKLQDKARTYWPGHVTLLLPDSQKIAPDHIRGSHDSIAMRVTTHPFVHWFSQNVSPLLVSTSANISGAPACLTYDEVHENLGHLVDYIVPGETLGAKTPSQIIHLETGKVMR